MPATSTSSNRSPTWSGLPRSCPSGSPTAPATTCWPTIPMSAPACGGCSPRLSRSGPSPALIPEFTKVFTSTESRHVKEVVTSSRQGGASLNILSGLVAGNFSAFWTGLCILALMFGAYYFSGHAAVQAFMPAEFRFAAPIFTFGLVAFGFLGMGPVTIAVDSFGPATDNAQSVYELSQIETRPNISADIEKNFGFKPD